MPRQAQVGRSSRSLWIQSWVPLVEGSPGSSRAKAWPRPGPFSHLMWRLTRVGSFAAAITFFSAPSFDALTVISASSRGSWLTLTGRDLTAGSAFFGSGLAAAATVAVPDAVVLRARTTRFSEVETAAPLG